MVFVLYDMSVFISRWVVKEKIMLKVKLSKGLICVVGVMLGMFLDGVDVVVIEIDGVMFEVIDCYVFWLYLFGE